MSHNSPYDDPIERDIALFEKEFERAPENFEPEVREAVRILADGGTPEKTDWASEVYAKAVNDYIENLNGIDWEDYELERQYRNYHH